MKLVWLPQAIATRDAQIGHVALDKPLAAIELGDRIEAAIQLLLKHPEAGRVGRVRGTREFVVRQSSLIVVYRLRRKTVEILRILHGAQQWPMQ